MITRDVLPTRQSRRKIKRKQNRQTSQKPRAFEDLEHRRLLVMLIQLSTHNLLRIISHLYAV